MMNLITIMMLAVGLSMDTFSVSLSSGICLRRFQYLEVMKIAVIFAFFQALMTIVGWLLGTGFHNAIQSIDHWIAFFLLSFMGGKMIYEANIQSEKESNQVFSLSYKKLITLGIATSIDALAVGVGMACLNSEILAPASIIFMITLLFSISGLFIGSHFGKLPWINIEIVGGVILILLGLKILVEHTLLL